MTHSLTIALAIIFFLAPLLYKKWKAQPVLLADFVACSLAAMSLPNLVMCLIGLIINPSEVIETPEFSQYLAIGILTILYLTLESIITVFMKNRSP